MKRTSRIDGRISGPLYVAVVLVVSAGTSASLASADDGPGPFAVSAVAPAGPQTARVGALFAADRRSSLAGGHFCTASVVHSPHRDLVVSAAPCLDGGDDRGLGFVPGDRGGRAPDGGLAGGGAFPPGGGGGG